MVQYKNNHNHTFLAAAKRNHNHTFRTQRMDQKTMKTAIFLNKAYQERQQMKAAITALRANDELALRTVALSVAMSVLSTE